MPFFKEHICKLRLTDFDRYTHLNPSALLDIFQDLATEQSIDMGMGLESLLERGMMWAVVRQKFEIFPDAMPAPHQLVRVRTWPHSPSSLTFQRDYALYDENDTLLAKGTSEWVILDIESRKFANVKETYEGPDDFCEERMFEKKLRKIKDFEAGDEPLAVVTPQFTDVDFNQHVNNARYLNFVMNALPPEPTQVLRAFQVDYRKELMPGEPVSLFALTDESGTCVKGVTASGDISFVCQLEY